MKPSSSYNFAFKICLPHQSVTAILHFSFPGLLETSLTYKPHVSAYWERAHKIQVAGHVGFLLSSKNQLKQVADSEEVKKTKEIEVEKPDIISPLFHLNTSKKTNPKFETGFYNNSPFPYPHTFIMVCEDIKQNTSQLVGQGKVQMPQCTKNKEHS